MQNIQLVDFVRLGAPQAPAQRFLFNLIEQRQTTLLAEFLESFRPTIGFAGSRITAAVTTAPTRGHARPHRRRQPDGYADRRTPSLFC
jgi:hypothetical protein